jgi:Bacterial regulatory proteins, tetR family/Outer membrane efflux protein
MALQNYEAVAGCLCRRHYLACVQSLTKAPAPEERREQIINAALEIFSEKGFEGTSNKEVARVAGIASPGLTETMEKRVLGGGCPRTAPEHRQDRRASPRLRIAQVRLTTGIDTPLSVSDAQATLVQSEVNHINARYDLLIALARLRWAVP